MPYLLFAGVVLFFTLVMVFNLSTRYKTLPLLNTTLLGRGGQAFHYAVLASSFILLSGMLAGLDAVWQSFGFLSKLPVLSVAVILVAIATAKRGVGFLEKVNLFLIPVILIVVNVMIFSSANLTLEMKTPSFYSGTVGVGKALLYVTMNVFTSLPVLVESSKNKTQKQNFVAGALTAIILCAQALLILCAISAKGDNAFKNPLPLLIAVDNGQGNLPFLFALFFAITTSVFTCFYPLYKFGKRKGNVGVMLVCLGAFAFSRLGLNKIVAYAYPIIGGFGFVYLLSCVKFAIKSVSKSIKIKRLPKIK